MKLRRALAMIVVVDFLTAIVLVQQAIIARSTIQRVKTPPALATEGVLAVTILWPSRFNDDVDLWVADPAGNVCYFRRSSAGAMNLEHDDLGSGVSEVGVTLAGGLDHERVVVRGAVAGEYVANAVMYQKRAPGPDVVTVELWSLRGTDRLLVRRRVTLVKEADERTAFRFTVTKAGDLTGTSRLQKQLVGAK